MKISTILFVFLLMTGFLFAQEESASQEMQNDEMKAWMEFMTPGDPHAWFEKAVGEWKVTNKYWYSPDSEPEVSEGTATAEMIMGGRYLQFTHHGTIMGMPFEGISIEGYDNSRGKYIAIWFDNMGTSITYSEGTFDNENNLLVYEGYMTDPMTKEQAWFKQTVKEVNKSRYDFEMFMKSPDGSEFKNMEITFTR